jgi:hypothetical protein
MKKSDKKGSHVEVIISFIIFVVFVFFIFSIIEPSIQTKKDKINLIEHVEIQITDRISADLTILTVKIIGSTSACISLDGELSNLDARITSKGNSGQSFNCYISSTDSEDLQIERTNTSDNFLKVYSSSAFPSLATRSSSCQSLQEGTGYTLGLTKTSNYIFESKVLELINENYETLKNNLNIPKGIDFGYGIILANGTTIETIDEELSTNIYIQEKPIEYVDSNGNLLMGALKIKVW